MHEACRKYRFRLSEILSLKQERKLREALNGDSLIADITALCDGRVLQVELTESGAAAANPAAAVKGFLSRHNISFEFILPERKAA